MFLETNENLENGFKLLKEELTLIKVMINVSEGKFVVRNPINKL